MTISYGPKLGLLENAATGEVHDNAFRKFLRGMDGMTQLSVKDKDLSTPPGSPLNGDCYLIAASPAPTGAWAGHANKIARYTTHAAAWELWTPYEGWVCWVQDEDIEYRFNGTIWSLNVWAAQHNDTLNKQGGTSGEYYHLTSAQNSQVALLNGTAGKTLSWQNTLTLAGTDGTTMTFPTTNATIARTDAAQTFSGVQTFSERVLVDITTEATTTTDGSIQTDGGLSAVKNGIFGGRVHGSEITINYTAGSTNYYQGIRKKIAASLVANEFWNTATASPSYVIHEFTGNAGARKLAIYESGRVDIAGEIKVSGNAGFNNVEPIAKPSISGSRGGNAALASLLTALANYGLITDSTTV